MDSILNSILELDLNSIFGGLTGCALLFFIDIGRFLCCSLELLSEFPATPGFEPILVEHTHTVLVVI